MPPFKKVSDLRDLSADLMAANLHKSLVFLDSVWKPPPLVSPGSTPSNSPCTSPIGSLATRGILPPESIPIPNSVEILRQWLFQMPLLLVELVLERVLQKIETIVHEDKDCKLILTLINIEKTKPSDFFFGVHAIFRLVITDFTIFHLSNIVINCLSGALQIPVSPIFPFPPAPGSPSGNLNS